MAEEKQTEKNLTPKDLVFSLLTSNGKGVQIKTPFEALNIVNNIISASKEVANHIESEKTKREEIQKDKEIALKKIQMQRDLLMTYLEKTYDERKTAFSKYFEVVDYALQNNNVQELAMGLENINDLAKSSPFKNLADLKSVGDALKDKNTVWDI